MFLHLNTSAMAETTKITSKKRYAVVTGGNKGIGFEICRQLASHGITVVLTARNEKRGLDALQRLKGSGGLSDNVLFHQLDVVDSSSVASLVQFIKNRFGRLDILVNNAGISGEIIDAEALKSKGPGEVDIDWSGITTETYELAVECVQINYYGAKRMVEAFIPLLQLSQSPRIVNVSSIFGKLELIHNGWAKGILSDAANLEEEKVDEVLNEYLKDFNAGCQEAKGWPQAYSVSKAALNAYTRMMAHKFPTWKVNCVCPGFVRTEINLNFGRFSAEEGAMCPVKLALLSDDGPSGLFFSRYDVTSFEWRKPIKYM